MRGSHDFPVTPLVLTILYLFPLATFAASQAAFHENEKVYTMRLGPLFINGSRASLENGDKSGQALLMLDGSAANYTIAPWPEAESGTLGFTGFRARILDMQGNERGQDFLYLHHVVIQSSRVPANLACPERGTWDFITGSGAELTDVRLQYPYYVRIPANVNETWWYALHVVNPETSLKVFYFEYNLTYVETKHRDDELVEVTCWFNSITSCRGPNNLAWNVESGDTYEYRALEFENTFTGTLVWAMGHLHRGGKNIALSDPTTGEIYFNSRAHYNREHSDWIDSIDFSHPMLRLEKKQLLRLSTIYKRPSDEQNHGVMGILMGYVALEERYLDEPLHQELIDQWHGYATEARPVSEWKNWHHWMALLVPVVFAVAVVAAIVALARKARNSPAVVQHSELQEEWGDQQ